MSQLSPLTFCGGDGDGGDGDGGDGDGDDDDGDDDDNDCDDVGDDDDNDVLMTVMMSVINDCDDVMGQPGTALSPSPRDSMPRAGTTPSTATTTTTNASVSIVAE